MKKHLLLIVAFLMLMGSLTAQVNSSSALLTIAIYEEEVSGNLEKAVTLYLDILKKYPNDRQVVAKTLYHLGLVSEKMGKQKADEYYLRLVNDYPDQKEMAALAKAKLSLFKNANAELSKKAERSFKLAADLFKQLKFESAVIEYEKVINLAPSTQLGQEARLWIGQCYFKEGKYEQALRSFNIILKDYPKSAIVPVAELMINYTNQAIAKEPQKKKIIILDDKTILDTETSIKYTKINTWAGANDVITSAFSISDISPNRKFLLADDKIVPFDNTGSFALFDSQTHGKNGRLSPDGRKIAFFTDSTISVMHVSPETGRPEGQSQKLIDGNFKDGHDLNWSSNGDNLIFSISGEYQKAKIFTLSIKDSFEKQVVISPSYGLLCPFFSKSGSNILYKQETNGVSHTLMMKSLMGGKSISILNYCAPWGKLILSPDNRWILYEKMPAYNNCLFRFADQQNIELSTPDEVGNFISWADDGRKVFFYSQSTEEKNAIKVASIFGGPAFEFGRQMNNYFVGWTPDSKGLFVLENGEEGKESLKIINLINQSSTSIEGLGDPGLSPRFSPDYSKILVGYKKQGRSDLFVLPVSLKDNKAAGKRILLFNGFYGTPNDYSWSPDGKRIAICSSGDLWICNASGGAPLQLTKSAIIENSPLWSYDGNSIAVKVFSANQIQIINASDGKILLTIDKSLLWDWTPDGKEITIAYDNGQISNISLKTGKIRKIANWKEINNLSELKELQWSPDGKWIAIIGYNKEEKPGHKSQMYLINQIDGKATEFSENEESEDIKWSPDSKWISFTSFGMQKKRFESTLWEGDLTEFMNKFSPGAPLGFTTDSDINNLTKFSKDVNPQETFTDMRDGHVYRYKKIGAQSWMTENLAYLPEVSPDTTNAPTSLRYCVYNYSGTDVRAAKETESYQKYGVLYSWLAATNGAEGSNAVPSGVQGACPVGWHLPGDAEWMDLETSLGLSKEDLFNEAPTPSLSGSIYKKLQSRLEWEQYDPLAGESGFNALPGGLISPKFINPGVVRNKSSQVGYSAYFWTSTPSKYFDRKISRFILDNSYYRSHWISERYALSIRCVKD